MSNNDIAIVGVSFEFPGANDLDGLWSSLESGERLYHIGSEPIREIVPAWGSLRDIQGFDYRFFGYSFKEACCIDPQQRLLLQHAWHALENAGYMDLNNMPLTGIYAAVSVNNYLINHLQEHIQLDSEDEILLGNANDFVATRVAYKLNLRGSALNVQCGCSSGLACVHEARVSLLTRQCDLALAGACALSAPHDCGYALSTEGIRSIDGYVRPFDQRATGTVFTNGVAVLVLKRLPDALSDGDTIYGTIASSALNNDGKNKASFTAPAVVSQAEVIKKAMRLAKARPDDLAFIEAHGTGTALGDPIEFEGLCRGFGRGFRAGGCFLQSMKANIGHLDMVSGLAGLIKSALVLQKRIVPPQINFTKANPKIELSSSPFIINTEERALPLDRLFAGVSSTGIGGTNVHVILRRFQSEIKEDKISKGSGIVLLSAKNPKALEELEQNCKKYFNTSPGSINDDALATSIFGRTDFEYRKAAYFEQGKLWSSKPVADNKPVAFLFSGQGSQYVGMGKDLYLGSKCFREKFDSVFEVLGEVTGRDYKPLILDNSATSKDLMYKTEYTQPLLLAFEVALSQYLAEVGIRPDVLVGHSLGEYTAAIVSGILSLKSGIQLVVKRAQLMGQTAEGNMLAVMGDVGAIESLLPPSLDIAGYNGPELLTVAGCSNEIDQFAKKCETEGIYTRLLQTEHAYHSRYLDPVLSSYAEYLSTITFNPPKIPIVSNIDGHPLSYERLSSPQYWIEHMRRPVQFLSCIQYIDEHYEPLYLEVGPGKALKTLTEKIVPKDRVILNTLPHPKEIVEDCLVMQRALGRLWEGKHYIDWAKGFDKLCSKHRVPLPTYPFEASKCWVNPSTARSESVVGINKYRRFWRQKVRGDTKEDVSRFLWVVLCEDSEKVQWLIDSIERGGGKVKVIKAGSLGSFCHPAGVDQLLRELESESLPIGLVNTLSYEQTEKNSWIDRLSTSALWLLTLLRSQASSSVVVSKVIMLTTQSCAFLSEMDPDKALLQAMVKTANQEYPNVSTRLIDLHSPCPIVEELQNEGKEPVVLLRDGERFVEEYESFADFSGISNKATGGVILIIGGMGHLGIQYAKALLQVTNSSVILGGRSSYEKLLSSTEEVNNKKVKELEGLRSNFPDRVHFCSVDVTDKDYLSQVCSGLIERFGGLDTIIHAAGVPASMHYRLMKEVGSDFVDQCFSAKRLGLKNIADVADEFSVRHCHVVSSISSVLSGVGMYVYSGMHAYIDGFVELMRRVHPSKWTSVNWEAWNIGTNENEPEQFQQGSFGQNLDEMAISLSEGEGVIKEFWNKIPDTIIVCSGNLKDRYNQWVIGEQSTIHPVEVIAKDRRPDLFSDYTPPATSEEKRLCELWSDILAIEKVGVDDNFFELGGHSLLALKMTQQISKEFNTVFSIVDLFEFPTIRKLINKFFHHGKDGECLNHSERHKRRQNHLNHIAAIKR